MKMTELILDGLTLKEIGDANESLNALYELKDAYADARRRLDNIEMQMAKRYDTVNMVLKRIKERHVEREGDGE